MRTIAHDIALIVFVVGFFVSLSVLFAMMLGLI
jgi:hypothetical protein